VKTQGRGGRGGVEHYLPPRLKSNHSLSHQLNTKIGGTMNRRRTCILIITIALLVVSGVSFGFIGNQEKSPLPEAVFKLSAPGFVKQAFAGTTPLGDYLDSEAGISAYYDSEFSINLNNAKNAFRTIETQTEDYIIGSVAVPNYVEHFDPHVYVHTSGWIMAYYLRSDPVSKIVDTKGYTISSTLLKTVVGKVAAEAGVPFTDVTYYDFRYPNATNMILVAEDSGVGDKTFTIKIPSSYGYYERGWNVAGSSCTFRLNGVNNPNIIYNTFTHKYGTLTASQLLPEVDHTVELPSANRNYGVLIIIYREQ
jgi:hypothetical protein